MLKLYRKVKKLQTKIMAVIASMCILIALVLGITGMNSATVATEQTLETMLLESIELAAEDITAQKDQAVATLTQIADNEIITGEAADEEKAAFLKSRAAKNGFISLGLVNKNGKDLTSGDNVSGETYFKSAIGGESYVTSPIIAQDGKSATIIVSVPVYNGKTVNGVMYAVIDQMIIQNALNSALIGESENADVYLLDKEGTTVGSMEHELVLAQENLTRSIAEGEELAEDNIDLAAIEQNMISGKTGVQHYKDGEGVKYMQAYRPIDGFDGWSISIMIDKDEFLIAANRTKLQLMILAVILIIIGVVAAKIIGKGIAEPISNCAKRLELLSEGDLTTPVPEVKEQDEVGVLAKSLATLIRDFKSIVYEIHDCLGSIADGDLSKEIDDTMYPGEFAEIKENMITISEKLNNTLGQIEVATEQVFSGSQQVSSAAQSLAQGATEQASSIQEVAATVNEVSDRVKNTAENANAAKTQSDLSEEKLTECSAQMKEMVEAMNDINEKSAEISKIIKAIEDIAFQTNILALNAAVEAARAGVAGKGFAVVADEVRNLAGKSAEASNNTAALIEASTQSVSDGMKILKVTADTLEQVVEYSEKTAQFVNEITEDAESQSEAIGQIREAVEQISSVVQTTSATSEESAATSEELSSQAQILKTMVEQFNLKGEPSEKPEKPYEPKPAYEPKAAYKPKETYVEEEPWVPDVIVPENTSFHQNVMDDGKY